MSKDYEPLHQKYRPQSFDDLIGQHSIVLTLKQAITTNRIAPAYLFSGPRGTGKTSSARILARSLNCISSNLPTTNPCGKCELCRTISLGSALDVIEIDAASNTGVDNIRELIEKAQFAPVKARWKIYVIDECHMLSTAAFNALLKTLEEPPKKVVFILATTDPQRVLPTIISRCQRFDFHQIPLLDLCNHLALIASKEEIDIENSALEMIAKHSQGGLRDAESMLDQVSLLPQPIKQNSIQELLGVIPENELLNLVDAMTQYEAIATLKICRNLLELGREPISILQGFASILRDLVITIAAPDQLELCNISIDSRNKLKEVSKNIKLENIYRWQSQLKGTESQLKQSLQPRLWLEILLLGLLDKPNSQKSEEVNYINDKNREAQNNPKSRTEVISDIDKKENGELSQIWEKILASLELPSTRMLLSQQATLTEIQQDKLEISVASNWISMIQSRKIIIEEAINKTLGSPRKLIIKSQNEEIKSQNNELVNKQNERTQIKKHETIGSNKNNSLQGENTQSNPLESNTNNSEAENLNSKNLEKFADFFNGEIVKLD